MDSGIIEIQDTFDFLTGSTPKILPPFMVGGDANAHRLSVACLRGGQPADIDGYACMGMITNHRGQNCQIDGSIADGIASVLFDASFYLVPGPVTLFVKLVYEALSTTIFEADTTVLNGTIPE